MNQTKTEKTTTNTSDDTIDVSIIVTTYKDLDLAQECIRTIIKSITDATYEIIVSDSATTPAKEKQLNNIQQEAQRITHIITNPNNIGYPRAVNAGIEKAKGNIIVAMNSDILVHNDAVQRMIDYIQQHEDIGVLAPKLLNIDGSIMPSAYRFYRWYTIPLRRLALGKLPWAKQHLNKFLMLDWDHSTTRDIDWIQGSVMMLRRSTIEKIGPMDANIFLYFEDVDWCRRAWESGLRVVYYPTAVMTHHHRRESANKKGILSTITSPMTRIHIRSALYYMRKNWKNPFPKDHKQLIPH